MTAPAASPTLEEPQSLPGLIAQRRHVTSAEAVHRTVLHLLDATQALKDRLSSQDRLQWAYEECRTLEEVNDDRPTEGGSGP